MIATVGFEYSAYDQASGLSVAAKIYDITSGAPVLVSTVTMVHVVNGSYKGQYSLTVGKIYLLNRMVYTDGTFATPSTNYAPASQIVQPTEGDEQIEEILVTVDDVENIIEVEVAEEEIIVEVADCA